MDLELRQDRPADRAAVVDGWVTRLSPRMTVARVGPATTLEISGLRSFDSYTGFAAPVRAGDAAGMRLLATPTLYSTLTANAGYLSTRDPLGSDPRAPVTFSESSISSGGARLELWRLEGEYGVRAHAYESVNASDGISQTWAGAVFPFRRPDTQALVGWRGRDLRIDQSPVLTTSAVTLGMRRTHYPGLSSELEVGAASTRDRVRGTNSWDLALVAGATVNRGTLRLPLDVRFRAMRDVATTGYVEASLPGHRRMLAARWEQTLGAEGGIFGDPTLARYLTFEVRDTLAGQYALTLEGSFGQTRSYFEPDLWLKTRRAWASLSRRVSPWLTAGLDYSYLDQDAASSVPSWVFRRSRVGLRLTVGAQ